MQEHFLQTLSGTFELSSDRLLKDKDRAIDEAGPNPILVGERERWPPRPRAVDAEDVKVRNPNQEALTLEGRSEAGARRTFYF